MRRTSSRRRGRGGGRCRRLPGSGSVQRIENDFDGLLAHGHDHVANLTPTLSIGRPGDLQVRRSKGGMSKDSTRCSPRANGSKGRSPMSPAPRAHSTYRTTGTPDSTSNRRRPRSSVDFQLLLAGRPRSDTLARGRAISSTGRSPTKRTSIVPRAGSAPAVDVGRCSTTLRPSAAGSATGSTEIEARSGSRSSAASAPFVEALTARSGAAAFACRGAWAR